MEIRLARIEDAKKILEIYAPYVLNTNITFEYDVPTLEEFTLRIDNTLKTHPYLVAIENNQIIGYAYASPYKSRSAYDWGCELSIYMDMNYQSKGVGKKLYQYLIETLKKQHYQIVYACITYPNDKSIAFHESFGFKKIAHFEKCGYKFNQWNDMIWMEKRIADPNHVIPINRNL